jgi:enolase-phosphatase E1
VALPADTRAVVLDIEGTTTPLTFVHDVLFPHARARLDEAVARRGSDPRIEEALQLLAEEHLRDLAEGHDIPAFGDGAAYARWLMDRDRKSTGLKQLQGVIWEAGYRDGSLRSDLFADVPRALAAWHEAGVEVWIYSSGSVLAQRLLFGHTPWADLTPWIGGWHDTTTGPKLEPASYAAIAREIGVAPGEVLFLSDARRELDAAAAAGLATGLLRRPGNPKDDPGPHPVYEDFLDLLPARGQSKSTLDP